MPPPEPIPVTPLTVLNLGITPYEEVLGMQRALHRALLDGDGAAPDTLLVTEHPSVITMGRSASRENILVQEPQLAQRGISVVEIERGGDVTYHGPGQIVCYPIIDLAKKYRDVGWYMRGIEECVLRTLGDFRISAERIPGKTGVWLAQGTDDNSPRRLQKIAAQGVRISRWKTLHGFSLNIFAQHDGFSLINPCGFTDIEVVSMEEALDTSYEGQPLSYTTVSSRLVEHFCEVFAFEPKECQPVKNP
jgi:lipoyl(octanoyl) transferase